MDRCRPARFGSTRGLVGGSARTFVDVPPGVPPGAAGIPPAPRWPRTEAERRGDPGAALAERAGLRRRIEAMFAGERINITENRPVLHVALRAPRGTSILVDGVDVVPDVHAVLDQMADFSEAVRSGGWRGHTGRPVRNV